MYEKRLTLRLMKYWELIRKDQPVPLFRHFHPSAIDEIWPFCFGVAVGRGKHPNYKYEYMGEPIATLYGHDLTGQVVDIHMRDFPGSVLHGRLDEVFHRAAPLMDDGHLLSGSGEMIKYRACLLPFGDSRRKVSHIVVGLSCRRF